ncbi:MAG: HAMP domain-containing histidine kinase [Chitinophagaceae bacterium]|nr:MAG: HAMP domain-containing histidine kinase [Chitinophagaceae bacterium]
MTLPSFCGATSLALPCTCAWAAMPASRPSDTNSFFISFCFWFWIGVSGNTKSFVKYRTAGYNAALKRLSNRLIKVKCSMSGIFLGIHLLPMHRLFRNIRWMPLLMVLTITGIAGFQYYWLRQAYEREKRTLWRTSNITFRETVRQLQGSKMKFERMGPDTAGEAGKVIIRNFNDGPVKVQLHSDSNMIGMVQVLGERFLRERRSDSGRLNRAIALSDPDRPDSVELERRRRFKQRDQLFQILYEAEAAQDTVRLMEVDTAFARRMRGLNLAVPFQVERLPRGASDSSLNTVTIGFRNPITFRLSLGNTTPFLMQRISGPIVLSVFLVLITVITFWVLYRNMLRQQRLAAIKNEFISNITHELKTPIATVSVAIEAMRSFGASMDAARTKEYLDISANELQRLSLLVDKVLKLSMFEKQSVDLKYEPLDLQALVNEVVSSMRLQFERRNATVRLHAEGDTALEGDRLNLVSVIFNLVDNALKYSPDDPQIDIRMRGNGDSVQLAVEDAGVGVPAEYRKRIFEKFFRVPTGNVHNAKGYGLGLSYVAHVVKKHNGSIRVEPNGASGSRFLITLPKHSA